MERESRPRWASNAAGVAVVAALAAAAFAVFGGVGLAKSGPGKANASQGQYGKKVEVCHKSKKTLRISVNAWPAHKRHGDSLGTCAELRAKKLKAKKLKAQRLKAAKGHGTGAKEKGKQAGAAGSDEERGKGGGRGKATGGGKKG